MKWHLDTYTRYFFKTKDQIDGKREQYDDSTSPLSATLTELYDLTVMQGTTELERFHLPSCKDYIRCLAKSDILLFLYKCQGNIRRFQIRFKSSEGRTGEDICNDCVAALSQFFQISKKGVPRNHANQTSTQTCSDASHTVTEGQNLSAKKKAADVYATPGDTITHTQHLRRSNQNVCLDQQNMTCDVNLSCEENIPQLLKMFLSDPSFPAFVSRVEKAIGDIVESSSQLMDLKS